MPLPETASCMQVSHVHGRVPDRTQHGCIHADSTTLLVPVRLEIMPAACTISACLVLHLGDMPVNGEQRFCWQTGQGVHHAMMMAK